jgi:hypothetical protein
VVLYLTSIYELCEQKKESIAAIIRDIFAPVLDFFVDAKMRLMQYLTGYIVMSIPVRMEQVVVRSSHEYRGLVISFWLVLHHGREITISGQISPSYNPKSPRLREPWWVLFGFSCALRCFLIREREFYRCVECSDYFRVLSCSVVVI